MFINIQQILPIHFLTFKKYFSNASHKKCNLSGVQMSFRRFLSIIRHLLLNDVKFLVESILMNWIYNLIRVVC